jgi:hypothetical protein
MVRHEGKPMNRHVTLPDPARAASHLLALAAAGAILLCAANTVRGEVQPRPRDLDLY